MDYLFYLDLESIHRNTNIRYLCLASSFLLMGACSFYSLFTPYLFHSLLEWLCPVLAFANSVIFGFFLNHCITAYKVEKLMNFYKPLFREAWLGSDDMDKMRFLKSIGFIPSASAPIQIKNFLYMLGINFESYADILSYCFTSLIVNGNTNK